MSHFSTNVVLDSPKKVSPWRKIAIGTWHGPGDPSVYGYLDIEVEPAEAYIEKLRTESGQKITLTHFVGKAMAEALRRHPELNHILRFGVLYPRKQVDVFFQVATDMKGEDLSGMTVRNADQKSLIEIAKEMAARVQSIRDKSDRSYTKMKGIMERLPGFLVRPILNITGFLMYGLNLWTSAFGTPRDPFGSIMVTSIGSLGLETAFAPLVPYSRVPAVLAVGAAREVPLVKDGQIQIGRVIRICATFDHRIIDGVHAMHMTKTIKQIFAEPEKELGAR